MKIEIRVTLSGYTGTINVGGYSAPGFFFGQIYASANSGATWIAACGFETAN